jgi:cell division protein FtsB
MTLPAVVTDEKPHIITLCGSTKFKETFLAVAKELALRGWIVLMPGVFGHYDNIILTREQKERLDALHKEKIDMSEAVYIINEDDYIGESTRNELKYARERKKDLFWLE